jgi:hypothetical protein
VDLVSGATTDQVAVNISYFARENHFIDADESPSAGVTFAGLGIDSPKGARAACFLS